jgi:hypothetical protein
LVFTQVRMSWPWFEFSFVHVADDSSDGKQEKTCLKIGPMSSEPLPAFPPPPLIYGASVVVVVAAGCEAPGIGGSVVVVGGAAGGWLGDKGGRAISVIAGGVAPVLAGCSVADATSVTVPPPFPVADGVFPMPPSEGDSVTPDGGAPVFDDDGGGWGWNQPVVPLSPRATRNASAAILVARSDVIVTSPARRLVAEKFDLFLFSLCVDSN